MRAKAFTLTAAHNLIDKYPDSGTEDLMTKVLMEYKPAASNRLRFIRRAAQVLQTALTTHVMTVPEEVEIPGVIEAAEDMREWATGHTFVFTSAQANTKLNDNFWASLLSLVEDRQAQLHISRFTYNKQQFGKNSVKPGSSEASDGDDIWFDPRIAPYVSDQSIQVSADLVWCGELNIIPTRVDPITGLENYGRGASIIIPHTKMAMRSMPTMKNDPARFCYTTGTVTARNYIEKAAGQKASLHHVYGALLVEVDEWGNWWARQINADTSGTVYDLTDVYHPSGDIERGVPVEIVTHGDLHGNKLNLTVAGIMSKVLDTLKPRNQVFHDTVDFQPRNHHNRNDPHFLHDMHLGKSESVEDEFDYIVGKMNEHFFRKGCKHWIVTSNHDQAIENWLRDVKAFYDPPNMEFWLKWNHWCARMRRYGRKPKPFRKLMQERFVPSPFAVEVVDEDQSLIIAGIENGMHGHLGPNGARGNPKNLRTAGKANTGHTHSAGIVDGVYTAGVFGDLDMGYNKGLSGWSHSFIITYENGKRTIVTINEGKAWR